MVLSKKKSYSVEVLRLEKISNERNGRNNNYKNSCASNETVFQQANRIVFRPFLGLLYTCVHAIFNQFSSVILKMLPYINPCQLTLVRHTGIFVAVLPIAIYRTHQIFGKREDRFLICIRALFGATGFYFQFMAYSYLPLAEASIIMSTLPLVTAVVARIVLKEAYGWVQSFSLFLTLCGIFLTLKLPELFLNRNSLQFDFTYIAGLMAAVGNVFLLSLSFVYVRKLKTVDYSVMMLYLGVIGMIENSIINGIFIPFVPAKCGWDQILCILLGASCFLSNYYVTIAVQVEPAGLAAVQRSSFNILVTMIFQIIFFNTYPNLYVISGACFILVSLIMIGISKWIPMMPETSKIRTKFDWLK